MSRVAVVTGSNKGIGFGIVRALLQKFDGIVYLTARNVDLGKQAVAKLNAEGLKPEFHQLDIEDKNSINTFAEYIKETHGSLDILVNNAAIGLVPNETLHVQAEKTLAINYFGTLDLCDALFPLLRSHARVVNVSCTLGLLKMVKSEEIRNQLSRENNTIDDINKIAHEYINALKIDPLQASNYSSSEYGIYSTSKVFLTAASLIQQKVIDKDTSREDIVINTCCPGYVATDLNYNRGLLTIDQGAETPVYLALLAENISEPRGQFVFEKKIVDWINQESKY